MDIRTLTSLWAENESWLMPVISLIVSTIVSTAVGFIVTRYLKKHFDAKDEREAENRRKLAEADALRDQQIRRERQEDVINAITKALEPVEVKIDRIDTKLDENSEGTVTLLRDRMKDKKDQLVDRGWATSSDVASWNDLYQSYKKLGGNHFKEYVDQWKHEVESLPFEKVKLTRVKKAKKND